MTLNRPVWAVGCVALPLMALPTAAAGATASAAFEVRVMLMPRVVSSCTATSGVGGGLVSVVCGPQTTAFSVPSTMSLPSAGMAAMALPGAVQNAGMMAVQARFQATAAARGYASGPSTSANTPLASDIPSGPAAGALVGNLTVPPADLNGPAALDAMPPAPAAMPAIELTLSF